MDEKKETRGRKTTYDPKYDQIAYDMCVLGHTEEHLAYTFSVSKSCIREWKKKYPSFLASIRRGRLETSLEVAGALKKAATGYKTTKPITVSQGGGLGQKIVYVEVDVPPNPNACKMYLAAHEREIWGSEKQVASVTVNNTISDDRTLTVHADELTDDQIRGLIEAKNIFKDPLD